MKLLLIMAAALLCAILAAQLNNRSLRKQVNKRTKELAARKNELQLIFDQMPEGVILVNEKGRIINGSYRFFGSQFDGRKLEEEGVTCSVLLRKFCGNLQCEGCSSETDSCMIAETLKGEKPVVR